MCPSAKWSKFQRGSKCLICFWIKSKTKWPLLPIEDWTLKASKSDNAQILGVSYSGDHCIFNSKEFLFNRLFHREPIRGHLLFRSPLPWGMTREFWTRILEGSLRNRLRKESTAKKDEMIIKNFKLRYSGFLKSRHLDIQWSKRGWFANGPDLEWDLKSRTIWNPNKWPPLCQKIHLKYGQKCPVFEWLELYQ